MHNSANYKTADVHEPKINATHKTRNGKSADVHETGSADVHECWRGGDGGYGIDQEVKPSGPATKLLHKGGSCLCTLASPSWVSSLV